MSEETIPTPAEPGTQQQQPDAAALARSVEKLEAKNRELREEKASIKSQLEELAKFKQEQEQRQLEASGSYEEAKAALQKQFDKVVGEKDATIARLEARIRDLELVTPASAALAQVVWDPEDVFATGRLKPEQLEIDPDKKPVVVNGLERTPLADWARQNLPRHYLRDPGLRGTGAPRGGGNASVSVPEGMKNPFKREHFNVTEQARLFVSNPDLYAKLKAEAGM